jgi:tol-pal system protein YbgF
MYPSLLMCTILAGCASQSSNTHKDSEPAAAEHIAKLEDKIIDLETRLTALNDKINLEEAEKPAASAKPANAKPVEASLPTEKVQPAAAAKNAVIPRSSKPQSKFAESFQQDDATDRYREAKIIYDSGKYADAILEFSDFVKDNPRHVLASNAQYFIGMSYLQQKEYKIAEEEFSRVLINYPHSNAIPDALLALVKVSDHLQKPARVTYFKEKLNSHFAQSPQAKAVAGIHKSEKTEIQKPHAPEPPTAPVPEMEHTDGVEPSVVNQ